MDILERMNKNGLWILLCVLLIATFFRTYDIQNTPPGLYPDEAMNGNNALEAISTGSYKVFYPENNGREGLFINIQALFLNVIGKREAWVLRLPSAIFGILTVAGVYFLAAQLFSKEAGLLAAFLIAVAHWHVILSRIGLRAITAPFFLTWAIAFLLLAFGRLRKERLFRAARPYFLLSGLFYGLGFHSYIAYRSTLLLVLIIFLYFLYYCRASGLNKEFMLGAITFTITAALMIAPLFIYFATHPGSFFGRASGLSVFNSAAPVKDLLLNVARTVGMLNVEGDLNWRHNVSGRPELFWPVGIFFWAGVLTGTLSVARAISKKHFTSLKSLITSDSAFAYVMLFIWLISTGLPVILSNERLPHALRAILMAPAIFILAAAGAMWVLQAVACRIGKGMTAVLLAALIVSALIDGYRTYFITWARDSNLDAYFGADYVAIGREINRLPDDVPKYVVVEAKGMFARGFPIPAQTVMFITDTFDEQNREKKNVYYLPPQEAGDIPPGSYTWVLRDIPSRP